MQTGGAPRDPSGHVFRVDRKAGPVWYAKYRLPDGRQVQKKIGPAWCSRGRPADGFFTKRTAEAWLEDVLRQACAGTLPGLVRTEATVADAAAEWLRYCAQERACKPSTMRNYRNAVRAQILPVFGERPLEAVTTAEIEAWRNSLTVCARSKNRLVTELHGIFRRAQRVWGLPRNPAAEVGCCASATPPTFRSSPPRRSSPSSVLPAASRTETSTSPPR